MAKLVPPITVAGVTYRVLRLNVRTAQRRSVE
jgi:hypothetical protein